MQSDRSITSYKLPLESTLRMGSLGAENAAVDLTKKGFLRRVFFGRRQAALVGILGEASSGFRCGKAGGAEHREVKLLLLPSLWHWRWLLLISGTGTAIHRSLVEVAVVRMRALWPEAGIITYSGMSMSMLWFILTVGVGVG